MTFPATRLRRLRANEALRKMTRETRLNADGLIYPIFVRSGCDLREPIESMPGQYRWSVDLLPALAREVRGLGVPAVILFGLPEHKDEVGTGAYDPNGIVQQATTRMKDAAPDLIVITDTCLDEYTSHGHCGMIREGVVDNDATLALLAKTAVAQTTAGADMVAPSDMMDGRVGAIRRALDEAGFAHTPIMAYAAKYASSFYGPFREAVDSAPQFGDRRSYQMDPGNRLEALREVRLDLEEGADIILVKPALAYLDVIREVRDAFEVPIAAYSVSGEYAMIKAAAERGWIDERNIVVESLFSMTRAGASMILTYHACDVARWLKYPD